MKFFFFHRKDRGGLRQQEDKLKEKIGEDFYGMVRSHSRRFSVNMEEHIRLLIGLNRLYDTLQEMGYPKAKSWDSKQWLERHFPKGWLERLFQRILDMKKTYGGFSLQEVTTLDRGTQQETAYLCNPGECRPDHDRRLRKCGRTATDAAHGWRSESRSA